MATSANVEAKRSSSGRKRSRFLRTMSKRTKKRVWKHLVWSILVGGLVALSMAAVLYLLNR